VGKVILDGLSSFPEIYQATLKIRKVSPPIAATMKGVSVRLIQKY